jgi:L-threonylcarbamoyladenylate synthase
LRAKESWGHPFRSVAFHIKEIKIVKTIIEYIDENNIDDKIIEKAAEIIKRGGTVVFPTETVYGLGANALNPLAVKGVFIAKGRPQDNPLIVHVADMNFEKYVQDIPAVAKKLMQKYWPGPMTIILNKSKLIPYETSAGLDSVGIRMPSNIVARELILKSGVPIAAPSANTSGKPSPTDIERCIEDLDGKVDFIIGGEKCEVGLESTIIDCTVYPPCVLRPGGITMEMLKEVDENIFIDPAVMKKPQENLRPKAPGMKYRHYAPKAPVKIVEGDLQKTIAKINEIVQNYIDDDKTVGIMATDETLSQYPAGIAISLGSRKDMKSICKSLFEVLRVFDDKNVDIIISEGFEEYGLGTAVMNRLRKSAGFNVIRV